MSRQSLCIALAFAVIVPAAFFLVLHFREAVADSYDPGISDPMLYHVTQHRNG